MVIKVKVSDVAAGFGVQNKEVLDLLAQCGAAKKSPSTVLEEGELNALFDRITKTHSVENFDKFYALRSNKPKSQASQQKKEKKPQSAGNPEKDKKRQSQAAILQMAEQAAKRAEEKAKKKANQKPQARTKGSGKVQPEVRGYCACFQHGRLPEEAEAQPKEQAVPQKAASGYARPLQERDGGPAPGPHCRAA